MISLFFEVWIFLTSWVATSFALRTLLQKFNFLVRILRPISEAPCCVLLPHTNNNLYEKKLLYSVVSLHPFIGPRPLFQFLNIYTVVRLIYKGYHPVPRPLPTHRTTQTQNKRTQTSVPWVGFAPTISVFEREKTFHALHRQTVKSMRFEPLPLEHIVWAFNTRMWRSLKTPPNGQQSKF
jgi:hypothetical protein